MPSGLCRRMTPTIRNAGAQSKNTTLNPGWRSPVRKTPVRLPASVIAVAASGNRASFDTLRTGLGTCSARWTGFCPAFRLHPLQSGETWTGGMSPWLAVFHFSSWVKQGAYDPQWGSGIAESLDFSDLTGTVGEWSASIYLQSQGLMQAFMAGLKFKVIQLKIATFKLI